MNLEDSDESSDEESAGWWFVRGPLDARGLADMVCGTLRTPKNPASAALALDVISPKPKPQLM